MKDHIQQLASAAKEAGYASATALPGAGKDLIDLRLVRTRELMKQSPIAHAKHLMEKCGLCCSSMRYFPAVDGGTITLVNLRPDPNAKTKEQEAPTPKA